MMLQLVDKDLVCYYNFVQAHKEVEYDDYIYYKNVSNGNLENENYNI